MVQFKIFRTDEHKIPVKIDKVSNLWHILVFVRLWGGKRGFNESTKSHSRLSIIAKIHGT